MNKFAGFLKQSKLVFLGAAVSAGGGGFASPITKRIKRSRSPTPDERPTFAVPVGPAPRTSISFKIPPQPINRETNKGAQLMAKMGWEGKGLGTKEQGIEEPVSGGEVREKTEQFRGLGSKPDIYEQYRRQMSTQMARRIHKLN
uniref:G-patch domain-containing protein n=1 Tax=Meloidogyne javanica TaxID=6303 RepID=A0A915NEF2_MELJA